MEPIKIALAKGRLAEKAIELFENIGIIFGSYSKRSRKLVFCDDSNKINLVFVKSSDIPIYVEKGTVDIGIVGKDVLMEERADIYEVLNLDIGKCKICVAGFEDYSLAGNRKLVVGTKYPNIAKGFFNNKGLNTEIIKLNGSVELAPILGLSDVIVDIVETGKTLKENGLVILDEICDISARMVINKVSLKTKVERIEDIICRLEEVV